MPDDYDDETPFGPSEPVLAPGVPETVARGCLVEALGDLKFALNVKAPKPDVDRWQTTADFLDDVCAWLAEYGGVVKASVQTVADMHDELIQYREARKAIRFIFGGDT